MPKKAECKLAWFCLALAVPAAWIGGDWLATPFAIGAVYFGRHYAMSVFN